THRHHEAAADVGDRDVVREKEGEGLEVARLHQERGQPRHVAQEQDPLHAQTDAEVDPEEVEADVLVGLEPVKLSRQPAFHARPFACDPPPRPAAELYARTSPNYGVFPLDPRPDAPLDSAGPTGDPAWRNPSPAGSTSSRCTLRRAGSSFPSWR